MLVDDFDIVFPDNVVGRCMISSCGRIRFEAPLNHTLFPYPELGRCWWLDHQRSAYAINHELAHVGSCLPFYGSFKENSLCIHFDGGGSLSNFSAWYFNKGKLTNIDFHWRFKYLSSFFNANALVFGIVGARFEDQNSVPGKMMGLASYGSYSEEMEQWLKENNYFYDCWGKKHVFFQKAYAKFKIKLHQLDTRDVFLQDILATLQHIFMRDFMGELLRLKERTKADNLYYAGGSALNIVANKAIVDAGLFDEVFIPPCTEDSGLSLGGAAFVEWKKHGKVDVHSPYLNHSKTAKCVDVDTCVIEEVARYISEGKVLGVCNGDGEIGPRALCNRSIVAKADNKVLADKVSMYHKGREWYRPVAPVMLEKNAKFYTGLSHVHHLADYMLLDFPIKDERKNEIEGVVHVDGTARIQVLRSASQNPFMYALLTLLDQKYGIKALINTSFNKRGMPIVHTTEDAVDAARNMKLDGLVTNGTFMLL